MIIDLEMNVARGSQKYSKMSRPESPTSSISPSLLSRWSGGISLSFTECQWKSYPGYMEDPRLGAMA